MSGGSSSGRVQIAEFRDVDFAEVYGDLIEKRGTPGRPYVVVNMVSSVDGKATLAGKAGQLGSRFDHELMRKIRAASDALIYGAGTLRAENVDPRVPAEVAERRQERGMRPQPLRVAVSALGDVPLDNLYFRAPGEPAVVFVGRAAPKEAVARLEARARVFVVGGDQVDLRRAMAILADELCVRLALCEGGPVLNYALFKDGLVDELLLTLAPKIVGGQDAKTIAQGPELAPEDVPKLALLSVHRHESELFLRYRVLTR